MKWQDAGNRDCTSLLLIMMVPGTYSGWLAEEPQGRHKVCEPGGGSPSCGTVGQNVCWCQFDWTRLDLKLWCSSKEVEPDRMPTNRGEGPPMCFMCAMALFLAVQQDEGRMLVARWRKLEIILLLRNIIQTQKDKYHIAFPIHWS